MLKVSWTLLVVPGKTIHVPFYYAVVIWNDGKDEFYDAQGAWNDAQGAWNDAHVSLDHGRDAWQTARSPFCHAVVDQHDGKDGFYAAQGGLDLGRVPWRSFSWALCGGIVAK